MTLSIYNKKILNFLYELTKLEKFMSYREIANTVEIEGKKVSPKTVQKWFNFLKRPYEHPRSISKNKFDYYPGIIYEKLGLKQINVILENADITNIPILPYQNYVVWLFSNKTRKHSLLINYLVPPKEDLDNFCKKLKKDNVINNYKIYKTNSGFIFYSPLHKVIDKNGFFNYKLNDENEIDLQLLRFKNFLNSLNEVKLIPEIKKDPLIIPTLFEYQHEFYSSLNVWKLIKNKLGDNVWKYFKKVKKQTDFTGIRKVQRAINDLRKFDLYKQIRIMYRPLEVERTITIYAIVDFKDFDNLIKSLKELALNSVILKVQPIKNNKVLIAGIINNITLNNYFNVLDNFDVENMFFVNYDRSLPLFTDKRYYKFDYSKLFDNEKIEWKVF